LRFIPPTLGPIASEEELTLKLMNEGGGVNPEIMAEQVVLMSEFDVNASWQKVKERYPFPKPAK
jgi:hypothetical protein